MQEINLLQNKLKDKTNQWEKNNRVVIGLLSFVLLAVLAATGMVYMLTKNAQESKLSLDQDNIRIQKELDRMEDDMVLAKGFQAQSKNIVSLLNSHVIWSNLMAEVSSSTFKLTQYVSMNTDTSGIIHVEGITASYTDLGKIILALETSEEVESVNLINTTQSTGGQAGIVYSLDILANQQALIEQN
jgi:Tfp pilus assembly protein PilN